MSLCTPLGPVHQVVYNVDLLGCIFQPLLHTNDQAFLVPDPDDYKPDIRDRTLASAACVCKTFREPATRVLWWSVPSLLPLWRILTPLQRLAADEEGDAGTHKYMLTGEVTPENWSRFRQYAARIRVVRCDAESIIYVEPSFWGYLAHYLQSEILLPRLQSLLWVVQSPHDAHLLPLLSPNLSTLELYFSYNPDAWGPQARSDAAETLLFRMISRIVPSLGTLKMYHLATDRFSPQALASLAHFKHLRRLDLCNSLIIEDVQTLQKFAALEPLEELENVVVRLDLDLEATVNVTGFRNLRSLAITADVFDAAAFLGTVSGTLTRFKFDATGTLEEWHEACEPLIPKLAAVRTLSLKISDPGRGNEKEDLAQFLEPCFQLRAIEDIDVRTVHSPALWPVTLNVGDGDVQRVFGAWPKLTSLSLDVHSDTSPTLRTLMHIARSGSSLRTLILPHLEANVQDIQVDKDAPLLPVHHHLQRLSFHEPETLKLRDPERTALLLSRMFPKLDRAVSAEVPRRNYPLGYKIDPFPEVARTSKAEYSEGVEGWRSLLHAVGDA